MKTKIASMTALAVVILATTALILPGCNASKDITTNRLQAEAELARTETDRIQVEAEAYQKRLQADTTAAAERSALRQTERDASHERVMETFPLIIMSLGLLVAGLATLIILWGYLTRPRVPDQATILLLQQHDHRLAEIERATWHLLAAEQRHQLKSPGPIIVYDSEEPVREG